MDWEEMYKGTPPWDTGRPQPAFIALINDGEIKRGRILDVGCGTGENALFLAENGSTVTGVDIVFQAVRMANEKAVERHVKADFLICDVLKLGACFGEDTFETVIDSGFFHTLSDEDRSVFVKQLYKVLKSEGEYFMMCFSDKQPGEWGPRRVSKEEIRRALEPAFHIRYIKDAAFESLIDEGGAKAYLVSANKKK